MVHSARLWHASCLLGGPGGSGHHLVPLLAVFPQHAAGGAAGRWRPSSSKESDMVLLLFDCPHKTVSVLAYVACVAQAWQYLVRSCGRLLQCSCHCCRSLKQPLIQLLFLLAQYLQCLLQLFRLGALLSLGICCQSPLQKSTAPVKVRKTHAPRNARQLPRDASVLPARSTCAPRNARLQLLHDASVLPAKSTRGHALLPEATHGQAQEPNEPRCGGSYGPSARLAGGRNTRGLSRASDQPCSAMIRHLSGMMPGLAVTSTHRDGSTWPIFDGIRPILTGTYRDGNRLRDPLCIQSSCLALLRNSQRIDGARGCIATQMSKLSRKLAAPFPVSARMRWRLAGPDGTLLCPEDRWHKCTYG